MRFDGARGGCALPWASRCACPQNARLSTARPVESALSCARVRGPSRVLSLLPRGAAVPLASALTVRARLWIRQRPRVPWPASTLAARAAREAPAPESARRFVRARRDRLRRSRLRACLEIRSLRQRARSGPPAVGARAACTEAETLSLLQTCSIPAVLAALACA